MKRLFKGLLFSCFILVAFNSSGQYVNRDGYTIWMGNMYIGHPRTGSITAPVSGVHLQLGDSATTKALWLPRFQTTGAISSPRQGMFGYSIFDSALYYRSLNNWWKLAVDAEPTSSDTTSFVWHKGGDYFPVITASNPPTIGTNSEDNFTIVTNATPAIVVPSGGLERQSGGTYKFMLFDTTGKNLGYGDAGTGTVTSVGLSMPSAFTVANSPVTGAGTIAVTGAGTTSQYIRGDGSLATYYGRFGVSSEDWQATANRSFSGAHLYNFTFDSLNFIVKGVHGAGSAVPNYNGTVMWFSPLKSAFRAGYNDANGWYNASVGNYSAAFGYNTIASGSGSFAAGALSVASGTYAMALGYAATASADWSIAMGQSATASATEAISVGGNTANYLYATAIGKSNTSSSLAGVTIGISNKMTGEYGVAVGAADTVSGNNGVAIGSNLKTKWFSSVAVGTFNDTTAVGSSIAWNAANPAFAVGIGTADNARANAFTVLQDGKTGIGIVTPITTLDVLGDLRFRDGTQAAGYVLTSDAGGLASWQPPTGGGYLANIGIGHRIAVAGTMNAKTLFGGFGIDLDSTSNADALTIKADTAELVTTHALNDSLDALGTLIIESDVGVPMATASGIDVIVPALLDGTNIDVVNTSDTSRTINITGQIAVANGGTGKASVTANSYLKGNGTSALVERTYSEVKTDLSLNNVDNTSDATKNSATATLTNKRWVARVGSTTSSATPTINTDNVDIYKLTAQAADITSFTTNLSGTPNDGDVLKIEITGTAARAITWGASFVATTVALPTTTVTTTTLTVIFDYKTTSSYGNNKWHCVNYY